MSRLDTGRAVAFIQRVLAEESLDCIAWPYYCAPSGYGKLSYKGCPRNAHRVVLELSTGQSPVKMDARHLCGVRWCVNWAHLEWSTRSVNLRDKRRHGTDRNVNKTHCKSGHPFDERNTKNRGNGNRDCRACNAEASRRYRGRAKVS